MTFLRLVISQALYFSLMLPTLAHSESTLDQVAIVIGAGPADGLACALGLSNVCKKVLLVEKHANFDRRGATFGLAKNGQKVLDELSPGLFQHMNDIGLQGPEHSACEEWEMSWTNLSQF